MYLEDCINKFDELFPNETDWQNQYIDSHKDIFINENDLKASFNIFNEFFFKSLNKLILSGEFIENPAFKDHLNELDKRINYLVLDYNGGSNEIYSLSDELNRSIIPSYKEAVKDLDVLFQIVKNKIENRTKHRIFRKVPLNKVIGAFLGIDNTMNNRILRENCDLFRIDFTLSVSDNLFQELIIKQITIHQDFNNSEFQKVLLDKIGFLLKKIKCRLAEEASLEYSFDSAKIEIPETIPNFQTWINYFEKHYDNGGKSVAMHIPEADEIAKKPDKSFLDYHKLVKFYKDNSPRDSVKERNFRIRNLAKAFVDDFEDIYRSSNILLEKYNKKAFDVSYQYLRNNHFSLITKFGLATEEEIFEELDNIEELQFKTGYKNYFPFQIICEYLLKKLKQKFDDEIKDFEEIRNFLSLLDENLKKFKYNFQWFEGQDYKVFQLPFDECIVSYNLGERKEFRLFLNSTFLLPTHYQLVKDEIGDFERKLTKYNLLFDFHENIKAEKVIIEDNKHKIESYERKNIEILSIFSAVVLFSIGEISMFGKIQPDDIPKFSLIFAYCLILFTIIIFLITRDYSFKKPIFEKIPSVYFYVLLVLTIATIFLAIRVIF